MRVKELGVASLGVGTSSYAVAGYSNELAFVYLILGMLILSY
jgi:hypothetical protein